MSNTIAPYNLAVRFKEELDYNPIASERWVSDPDDNLENISDWEISKDKWDRDWYKDLDLFAPTLAQYVDYFRNNWKIDLLMGCYKEVDNAKVYGCTVIDWNEIASVHDGTMLEIGMRYAGENNESYEQALVNGLNVALNLMKTKKYHEPVGTIR